MGDERDAQCRAAVLAKVYDQLVAEMDAGSGKSRHAELQAMAGGVESALSRCRAKTGIPGQR